MRPSTRTAAAVWVVPRSIPKPYCIATAPDLKGSAPRRAPPDGRCRGWFRTGSPPEAVQRQRRQRGRVHDQAGADRVVHFVVGEPAVHHALLTGFAVRLARGEP